MSTQQAYTRFLGLVVVVGAVFCLIVLPRHDGYAQNAASALLTVSPVAGSYPIGSTFEVVVAINTGGKAINAFDIAMLFPADKLQIVDPDIGESITGFWVSQPTFSNQDGTIELKGGVPNPGINTDFGVIATLTFRVREIGQALIRFGDGSKAYLNDGNGTEAGLSFRNAIYTLMLPPPAGPIVVSSTHPDQDRWYNMNGVILQWTNDAAVEGYSYLLNKNPVDLPDDISEGKNREVAYQAVEDGINYFHIKSFRNGVWGGVTHYAIKIQTSGPAGFDIEARPGTRTSSKDVLFIFSTTDPLSGIDHYDMKIIPLQPNIVQAASPTSDEPFFFEVVSPHIITFDNHGKYEVVVRAVNKAGSFTEEKTKVSIVHPMFQWVSSTGLLISGAFSIPWFVLWSIMAMVIGALFVFARHMFRWHVHVDMRHHAGALKAHHISVRFEKLKEIQARLASYKSIFFVGAIMVSVMWGAASSFAQTVTPILWPGASRDVPTQQRTGEAQLSPPVVNLFSEHVGNDEIFYIGGKAASGNTGVVVLFMESLSTGETFSFEVPIDGEGNWFYSHPKFLQGGEYLLWTQLKVGNLVSPPSGQSSLTVSRTAFQLGSSRFSLEALYLLLLLFAIVIVLGLVLFIVYHRRQGIRKEGKLQKEIAEAETSLRHGFDMLRRDLQAELELLKNVRMNKALSAQEKEKEVQLKKDMEEIDRHIGKELWDIEKALGARSQ